MKGIPSEGDRLYNALLSRGYSIEQIQELEKLRNEWFYDKPHDWVNPFSTECWWDDYSWLDCDAAREMKKLEERAISLVLTPADKYRVHQKFAGPEVFDAIYYRMQTEKVWTSPIDDSLFTPEEKERMNALREQIADQGKILDGIEAMVEKQRNRIGAMVLEYRSIRSRGSCREIENEIAKCCGFMDEEDFKLNRKVEELRNGNGK